MRRLLLTLVILCLSASAGLGTTSALAQGKVEGPEAAGLIIVFKGDEAESVPSGIEGGPWAAGRDKARALWDGQDAAT